MKGNDGGSLLTSPMFNKIKDVHYRYDYENILQDIKRCEETEDWDAHANIIRTMSREDLFFLLYYTCYRVDVNQPFVVERCYEVNDCAEDTLDLWAREFYKSTVITFGKNLQRILRNPSITIGIFSHTRGIAKTFLREFKVTFQANERLKGAFSNISGAPDVVWAEPEREAYKWSEDEGLYLPQNKTYRVGTIEAWGLVDSQPTSKHFDVLCYDDIVTIDSVSTPEQIQKTTSALQTSYNLGKRYGVRHAVGTRYDYNDTYKDMIDTGEYDVRTYPAEDEEGNPVFLSREELDKKRNSMGKKVYACQMLLKPEAGEDTSFDISMLRNWHMLPSPMNKYLIVDAATKKGNDYTTMMVMATDSERNYLWIDGIRDKLSLRQKWIALKMMIQKHKLRVAYYEEYGPASDIEYMEERMQAEGIYFKIERLGGTQPNAKKTRISSLTGPLEEGRLFVPVRLPYTNHLGEERDLVFDFIYDEMTRWPSASGNDDMLDGMSRIFDPVLGVSFPTMSTRKIEEFEQGPDPLDMGKKIRARKVSYMGV